MRQRQSSISILAKGLFEVLFVGGGKFYLWMTTMTVIAIVGAASYSTHLTGGLVYTNMRDQVNWGFYIANFAFLVGIAAAAVLLIIPAYLYGFKPLKQIVIFGELMAITALMMAMMLITADMGGPERVWHILPKPIGNYNFPSSILGWDMLVLNGYLAINMTVVMTVAAYRFYGKEPNMKLLMPLIILSIPWAVGVHTVTAFVFNGLAARPFWNSSILAPRFLASAFCAGPALMILVFQVLRKVMDFKIDDEAISKLSEIMVYAMAINLFLLGSEIYKEYYSATEHLSPMKYLYQGLDGHNNLTPWIWTATIFNFTAFLLFLNPSTRKNIKTLNLGCVLMFVGIWIEKGMCLVIPGFIPDTLGEIYEYMPSTDEVFVVLGAWAFGAMLYTLMIRTVIAIETGKLRKPE